MTIPMMRGHLLKKFPDSDLNFSLEYVRKMVKNIGYTRKKSAKYKIDIN